jgi:hypothetical protein
MFISLLPRKKRYGLKIYKQITSRPFLTVVLTLLFLCPSISGAQDASWWGSSSWFDWSDFRGSANFRLFFARLSSASATINGQDIDFKERFNLSDDPEVMREAWFQLNIDRLGLRLHIEDAVFHATPFLTPPPIPVEAVRGKLDFGAIRAGVDLDVIRYPFFRLGANFDYGFEVPKFIDNRTGNVVEYKTANPVTIGLHAYVIPGRIRDIPIFAQARGRFPIPLIKQNPEVKITDWEVSGGLRPSIWQTSLYGFSTFAVSLEGGFRSVNLNMDVTPDRPLAQSIQASMKAQWQGAFVQLGLIF